jgi:CubicO group peptidase (beta-lactamase class C family)
MKKTVVAIAFLLTIAQIGLAQIGIDKVKLDQYFDVLEENNMFMGSVAVSRNGELVYARTIGLADVENKVKANDSSRYRVGSISKSFTAVLTLKAIEEHKLDLDQAIDKWFPVIRNAKRITVKHLLSHRSGIHDFTQRKDYPKWYTKPKTEREMIQIIAKGGSDFKPDTKARYSNSNYVLLTYILEKIYAKSYSDMLQEYIVRPVGLRNTYVFGKVNTSINECQSYSFSGVWELENETHFTIPLGAGAIASTASDLTMFADALFSGKLLRNESLELMKTIEDGYGIGLFELPFEKHRGYGHSGGIDGFVSRYAHFADSKISFALVSNGRSSINTNDVSIVVLSAVYGLPIQVPTFSSYELAPEAIDQYLGTYVAKEVGVEIAFTRDGNTLRGEIAGEGSFPLQPTGKDKFYLKEPPFGFTFNLMAKTMVLTQSGVDIKFRKK